MTHHTAEHRSDQMNRCISDCFQCAATCIETTTYCLEQGGAHATPDHIGLMQTCAEICAVSGNAMLRGVQAHAAICGACAEVCRRCAESCERVGTDTAMQRCIDACRKCAESCGAMAASA